MPSLSMIQAATPKCPGSHTNINTHAGLAHRIPCGRPMLWDATAEQWRCASHGMRTIGLDAVELA
jgi:hypothetical protein